MEQRKLLEGRYENMCETNDCDCVFCKIINKETTAHVVYENDTIISFLDIEPIHEGYVLIVPKSHVDTIDRLSEEIILDIMKVAKKVVKALRSIYKNEGYSIMQNGGKFCDFGHIHFHVFPRYDEDGFGWTYPEEESHYSERVADRLREYM